MPVRRLTPQDADLLRTIRLRALQDAATAFGSSYERELAFTEEDWASRLRRDGNSIFVDVGTDGEVAGIAAGLRDTGDSSLGHLVSMWVAPDARGSGVADRLVVEVMEWARGAGLSAVLLHVTDGNIRAEKLYERHGFHRTGMTFRRERDGLTEIEMEFRLTD